MNFPLVGEVSEILVPDSPEGRYRLAWALTSDTAVCSDSTERQTMDRLLLHPFWGLPCFFLIMGMVFLITFQWAGPWLSRGMDLLTDKLRDLLSGTSLDVPAITDGLLSSAGYVFSFLPFITVLSLLLTLLEDVGYLPRAAFLLDGWLKKLGLDGRCAIPLLLGFGCTVPAVMATRTLPEQGLRKRTVRLLPFVPCSARLPFLLLLGSILFRNRPARGALLFYGLSLLVGVVYGSLTSAKKQGAFYLELPPLRIPRLSSVLRETEKHLDHFLRRAGLILLPTSFLLWTASHVNILLHPAMSGEESLLSALGRFLLPLFRPLGFEDWRAGVILLSGAAAKESMASAAALFLGEGLYLSWQQTIILGVVSLLLPPCLGTLVTVRGEFGAREAGKMILRQLAIAWTTGLVLHWLLHFVSLVLR